jgi:hypothetical protein
MGESCKNERDRHFCEDEDYVKIVAAEDTPFTPDGLGCRPTYRNYFNTTREALLAFAELVKRHPEYDYVDIVMCKYSYGII